MSLRDTLRHPLQTRTHTVLSSYHHPKTQKTTHTFWDLGPRARSELGPSFYAFTIVPTTVQMYILPKYLLYSTYRTPHLHTVYSVYASTVLRSCHLSTVHRTSTVHLVQLSTVQRPPCPRRHEGTLRLAYRRPT